MTFLKLFKRIILKNIRSDRFLTVLSIIGIALGIGLFLGVNVATNQAASSFESDIAAVDPAFNYEVVNPSGIDFHEEIYRDVRRVAEMSVPLLTARAYLPGQHLPVDLTGIYMVRAFSLLDSAASQDIDLEKIFTVLNGVMVTKKFSDRYGLKKKDTFSAFVYDKVVQLSIVGVLDLNSVPFNTFFMDLGNYQELFGKNGFLSRIDLVGDESKAAEIANILPSPLSIQKKELVIRNRQSLIHAFRYNLKFVTFLAVLVGVFLLYNTIFIAVVKRRTEIGILRALGMSRKTIVALFSTQGMALGLAGSFIGIGFGHVSASLSTTMVGKTVTRFYGNTGGGDGSITIGDAAGTLALGLLVSFLASFIPALEAANTRPAESWQPGTFEKAYGKRQLIFSAVGVFCLLAGTAAALIDYTLVPFPFPWLSHAGILLLILGCTLNAPVYLGAFLALFKKPIQRQFKTAGRVAAGDIRGTRYRFSLALMSVAVSSALIIAIVSSIYSLKQSFVEWIDTYISADVYIKAASCSSNFCLYPLPADAIDTVRSHPAVESVDFYRSLLIDFRGKRIVAGFGNSDSLWKRRGIDDKERERLERLSRYPEVYISDYLAVQYGLKKGDTVEVQTPRGKVGFTVNNSSISYSTLSGFMYFDRRWLKEYWDLDDSTQISVHLKQGRNVQQFMDDLEKTIAREHALEISDNRELKESVLRIFDRSFAITYTIELIAIVISLIGVVNALLILVLEKKREISILRYLGATWLHIRAVMTLSAAIIGTAGILLGTILGTAISLVITHVVNKISFGWEVAFRVPVLTVTLLMILLFLITVSAGIIPSVLARKIDPKAYISFE